jgi:hypothetical protein
MALNDLYRFDSRIYRSLWIKIERVKEKGERGLTGREEFWCWRTGGRRRGCSRCPRRRGKHGRDAEGIGELENVVSVSDFFLCRGRGAAGVVARAGVLRMRSWASYSLCSWPIWWHQCVRPRIGRILGTRGGGEVPHVGRDRARTAAVLWVSGKQFRRPGGDLSEGMKGK